jgi:signal transduction histidine kinase
LGQRVAEHSAQTQRQQEQLQRVSSRLAQAETFERQRLAHLLHDNLQQLIFGAKLRIPIIRKASALDPPCVEALEQADSLLQQAMGAARNLSIELNPPSLRQGLLSALRWLAQWMLDHYNLRVTLSADETTSHMDPSLLPQQTTTLLFQSVREMLFNVAKHARTSHADVRITGSDSRIRLTVRDKGQGFDTRTLADKPRSSLGLSSVQERIEILDGHMHVASQPDKGTTITVTVPLTTPRPLKTARRRNAKTTQKRK